MFCVDGTCTSGELDANCDEDIHCKRVYGRELFCEVKDATKKCANKKELNEDCGS